MRLGWVFFKEAVFISSEPTASAVKEAACQGMEGQTRRAGVTRRLQLLQQAALLTSGTTDPLGLARGG